jgi:hypothetical protein
MKTSIMISPKHDNYISLLPDGSHKFKHRIIVKRDSEDSTRVLTAVPVINTESKELVAFIDIKWEKDDYNRKIS